MAVLGKISLRSKLGFTSSTLEDIDMNLRINVDKTISLSKYYISSHLLLVHLPLHYGLESSLTVGALTRLGLGAGLATNHPGAEANSYWTPFSTKLTFENSLSLSSAGRLHLNSTAGVNIC